MASQIISIILKFVSRTIFISILGTEYLGINGLFSEILQVLALADLGFGTAMVFSLYKPLADRNKTRIAQLVQFYKIAYRCIAIAVTGIGVILIPALPLLVNLPEEIPDLTLYYLLYLANTVASYLVVYKTCILEADQKNYLISKWDTIFNLGSTIGCSLFLYVTHNFLVYLLVQVGFTYLRNAVKSYIAQKNYPFINDKVEKLPDKERNKIFENIRAVFVYKVANTLVGSTDNTLISIMVGTIVVGLYSNYSMLITNVTFFINIIFGSVTASIGNLIVEKNMEKNYAIFKTMQFVSFIISSIAITCVYCLINDFIRVWIGAQYTFDLLVVIAIVINMYFSVVLMPIWSYREATGMYLQTKYVMVATAIVNLIMSIVLGKWLGLAGILFATSIARLTTYFWYEPRLLYKQYFGNNVADYYIKIGFNIIITIISIVFVSFICSSIGVFGWGTLLVKAICVGICASTMVIAMNIHNPEMKNMFQIVKRVVLRR